MEEKIIKNLSAVLQALNAVTVSGKSNLSYLSGSIGVLEETVAILQRCDICEKKQ